MMELMLTKKLNFEDLRKFGVDIPVSHAIQHANAYSWLRMRSNLH